MFIILKVEQQLTDTIKSINERLTNIQPDYEATNEAFKNIEKEVDKLREAFYRPFRPIPKFMEPLDLNKLDLQETRLKYINYTLKYNFIRSFL